MNRYLIKFTKDIGKLNSYLLIGALFFLLSCAEKKIEIKDKKLMVFEEFNIVYPHLNLDNSWNPNIESIPNKEYFLQMQKKDSLALFNNIWLQKNIVRSEGLSDSISEVCYSIPNIFYYWFDGKEGKMVEYNDQLDTLWEYKHVGEITDRNQEIFIRGKYQYMYSNQMLTKKQRKYFESHKDSLRKVEGNDLPNLPEYVD